MVLFKSFNYLCHNPLYRRIAEALRSIHCQVFFQREIGLRKGDVGEAEGKQEIEVETENTRNTYICGGGGGDFNIL
jgi:hypothetical protein